MDIFKIKTPFLFTIFGASGDLAKIKLFPALYSLARQNRLPENYQIIGFARTKKSDAEFKKEFRESIIKKEGKDINQTVFDNLLKHVRYYQGQYDNKKSFADYRKYLHTLTKEKNCIHLAYFSVPPQAFKSIVQNLAESATAKNEDMRLIIEKPFGSDAKSAEDLYHFISGYYKKEQIYLLDHYLGKSGIQSILNLRHSNRLLNTLLKGKEIANIQISALEDVGVTNRIGYFEQVGIVRDMLQSHLLQILALITMSIPISERAEDLQREKYSILSALKVPQSSKNNFVLGQYETYKKSPGVGKNSRTETFAAIKLLIDRESWYQVPIYIRTGKKLSKKQTYIVIEFKKFAFQKPKDAPNLLIISVSPEEKISIQLVNKYRSGEFHYETVTTSESIACSGDYCLPEHGILLLDVIRKNRIHFLSFEEILASWKVTEALCKTIRNQKIKVETYNDLSAGPESQHRITGKNGFTWHNLT